MDKSATQRAKDKYQRESVDRIVAYVPKGSKDKIQDYADGEKISVNELVIQSIETHTGMTIRRPEPNT